MFSRREILTAAGIVATAASSTHARRSDSTITFVAQSAHLQVEIPAHWAHTPPLPSGTAIGADDGFFRASPIVSNEGTFPSPEALWLEPPSDLNGTTVKLGNIEGKRYELPATPDWPAASSIVIPNPNPIITWEGKADLLLLTGDNDHFDRIIESVRFGIVDVSHKDLTWAILDWAQAHSYFRSDIEWEALYNQASTIQTRQSINGFLENQLLNALYAAGDNHSMLMNVNAISSRANGQAGAVVQVPTGEIIAGFGYLSFPGNLGLPPETLREYVRQGCLLRNELNEAGVNGWIIDLRNMQGGSIGPVLTSLYSFLPDGKLAGLVDAYGNETWIEKQNETIFPQGYLYDVSDIPWPQELADSSIPVAVLTGLNNGSAGEFMQLALMSRENLQTFGMRTAGFTLGNTGTPLFNGMWLALASSAELDAAGNVYTSYIEPDVEDILLGSGTGTSEEELALVLEWLRQQTA